MNQEEILCNLIGQKIKKRRIELGITQAKLADITNYSDSFIANLESKTYQSLSISALNRIACALATDISMLLPTGNEIKRNSKITIICKNCSYNTKLPLEIILLLNDVKMINNSSLAFTCPECGKKSVIEKNDI